MNKNTHLIAGAAVGIYLSSQLELTPIQSLLCLSFSAIGSLLPDLDTPTSYLGRRILLISYPLSKAFGHRTITHSLLFWTILFIAYPSFFKSINQGIICFATYGGVLSHILLDFISPIGVPLFYPISNKRFHLLPRTRRKLNKRKRKRLPI
ncbi:MAG: metal-dependent hydrolase [Cellulosilyticaceae bacterium]